MIVWQGATSNVGYEMKVQSKTIVIVLENMVFQFSLLKNHRNYQQNFHKIEHPD